MNFSKFSTDVKRYLDDLIAQKKLERIVIAISGGLDSSVLLHSVAQILSGHDAQKKYAHISLLAVHVNHHISPHADLWQAQCEQLCEQLNCTLQLRSVQVNGDRSIEEQARKLRYQAFAQVCEPHDLLLTAHHLYDQSETMLFRFFRGAGGNGLQGIPVQRALRLTSGLGVSREGNNAQDQAMIWRPLLNYPQSDLRRYADEHDLHWVDDESNLDVSFTRNFLRHSILPLLRKKWPELDNNLSRTSRFFSENEALLDDLGALDYEQARSRDSDLERWGNSISLRSIKALNVPRAKNLFRYWLKACGRKLPSEQRLIHLIEFCHAHEQTSDRAAAEYSWQEDQITLRFRIFEQCLFFHCEANSEAKPEGKLEEKLEGKPDEAFLKDHRYSPQSLAHERNTPNYVLWDFVEQPELFWGAYSYSLERVSSSSSMSKAQALATEHLVLSSTQLIVKLREGGERCKPVGRQHSQTLKKLFQEYRIPLWERDSAPIFYRCEDFSHEEALIEAQSSSQLSSSQLSSSQLSAPIIAVANFWLCDGAATPTSIGSSSQTWRLKRRPLPLSE